MAWLVTPLSYLGLAPMSYAPAVPTTVAAFSALSGLNTETAILAYSMLLGMVVTWNAFLLGFSISRRNPVGLVLAFLVSTAGGVIAFTDWTLSTRGTFIAILPLALALFVRAMTQETKNHKQRWIPFGLVVFSLALVHLMWLMLIPMILGAWMLYRIAVTEESLLRMSFSPRTRSRIALATYMMVGIIFSLLLYRELTQFLVPLAFPSIRGGVIPDTLYTRAGVYLTTMAGLGIVLAPVGIFQAVRIVGRRQRYSVLSLAVVFVPLVMDPAYGILIAIPVLLLFSASAIRPACSAQERTHSKRPIAVVVAAAVMAIVIVVVPAIVTVPRVSALPCGQSGGMIDLRTYDLSLHLRYTNSGAPFTFISDSAVISARVEAISGRPSVEPILSIGVLEYPWLAERTTITLTRTDEPLTSLLQQQQLLKVNEWIQGIPGQRDYYLGKHTLLLLNNGLDSRVSSSIMDYYHTTYAIQTCSAGDTSFFSEIQSEGYVVFVNEAERIYWIPR